MAFAGISEKPSLLHVCRTHSAWQQQASFVGKEKHNHRVQFSFVPLFYFCVLGVLYVCTMVHMWQSEDNFARWFSPSALFEKGLLFPVVCHSLVPGTVLSPFHLVTGALGLQTHVTVFGFYVLEM